MDFQATSNWRVTGRYMHNNEDILQAYGTTWAGNGSDQVPTPTLFVHPAARRWMHEQRRRRQLVAAVARPVVP